MLVGLTAMGLVATAAAEDPNVEPMVLIGLLHQGGAEHPWGVEIGTEWLVALGDHCGYRETDCRGGAWWPIGGPRAALTWRGGTRVGGALELVGGVAAVDMYQYGFFPMFGVEAAFGLIVEIGALPAASFGGTLTKSLSYRLYEESGAYREIGLPMLSAAFAARGLWDGELRGVRSSAGLEMATFAGQLD